MRDVLIAGAVATVASMLGILLIARDMELIGLGAGCGLVMLPSILAFLVFDRLRALRRFRSVAYLLPWVIMEIPFVVGELWGNTEMPGLGWAVAGTLLAGGVTGLVACLKLVQTSNRR